MLKDGKIESARIPTPMKDAVGTIQLSPDGSRLLIDLRSQIAAPAWQLRLHRWISAIPANERLLQKWFVCRTNGSGLHEVASQTIPISGADALLSNTQWTPDGKHFSAFLRNHLVTVPID